MTKQDYYAQLCETVRDELNVKVLRIKALDTEKGLLTLEWDGLRFVFRLGEADVTTSRLLDTVAPEILRKTFGTEL